MMNDIYVFEAAVLTVIVLFTLLIWRMK